MSTGTKVYGARDRTFCCYGGERGYVLGSEFSFLLQRDQFFHGVL